MSLMATLTTFYMEGFVSEQSLPQTIEPEALHQLLIASMHLFVFVSAQARLYETKGLSY